jgi:hypothetical protein
VGAICERIDEQIFIENILMRLYSQIERADIIVSDMTGQNANVFYEAGYAHALQKGIMFLTQDISDIPFDLRHYPHIVYSPQNISGLKDELHKRLNHLIIEERKKAPGPKRRPDPFILVERYHLVKKMNELLEDIRYDYERIRNGKSPERIRVKDGETLEATEVRKLLDTNRGILGDKFSEQLENKYSQAILLWNQHLDWESEMRTWKNTNDGIQKLIEDELLLSGA